MAFLTHDQQVIETAPCETARFYTTDKQRTVTVFDRERDNFLLVDEGWDGYERVHQKRVHVELRGDKFWIHCDGTQDGVAAD